MQKQYDVITFSDMCVDLILTGADVTPQFGQVEKLISGYTLEMGGSCNIFACQAARLGLRTAVLGRVGDDDFGRLILRRLQEYGVDTRFVKVDPSLKTGLGVALCPPGDRAILTYLGTIDAVYPEDMTDEILSAARHVHHASYYLHTHLQPALPQIFARARSLGATTSLDTNWDPSGRWDAELEHVFPFTDLFLPNEQEALLISRQDRLADAAAYFLGQGVKLVAVKQGSQGAITFGPHGSFKQEVDPVNVGDSIGAGDSFDAGFLAGWLRGWSPQRCLAIANTCGSAVASRVGGLAGQSTWNDLNSLF
jgi:sugar/nucleoside kinase (ribokinase family)